MIEIYYPSYIEVDLAQFKKNIGLIKKYVKDRKVCLPIKANGYGHGICQIAATAAEAGVDYLAVARVDEGAKIREKRVDIPILLISPFFKKDIPLLVYFNLEPTISCNSQLLDLTEYFRKNNKRLRVHVEIDTGMIRSGVNVEEANDLIASVISNKYIDLVSIYSHFVAGKEKECELSRRQAALFKTVFFPLKKKYPLLLGHICHSGGLIHFPEFHYDMVRPGTLSYGLAFSSTSDKNLSEISTCFSLKSKVGLIHTVGEGQGIGYNHTYFTSKKTKIAVLPIGYGDGYPFLLSNRAEVLIRGRRLKIVGRICMDLLMVDIGDLDVCIGDEVVLIGKQGDEEIKISDLAQKLQTIVLEIVTGFTSRLPIVYKS